MPTTALTVTPGPHKYSEYGKAVTMAAADVSNGNHWVAVADQELIVHNSGGSTRTVTITGEAINSVYQRAKNVGPQNILAGEIRVFRLPDAGYKNSSGNIVVAANHADVKLGVVDFTQESLTA